MSDKKPSSRWPRPTGFDSFFGRISLGDDGLPTESWKSAYLTPLLLPFPMRRPWQPDGRVRKILCHAEVRSSLARAFDSLLVLYPDEASRQAAGVDLFGGCYEYRAQRGTQLLSMHAYGAAFDFCLPPGKELPIEVIDAFEREGWSWAGGRKTGKESNHFEAVNRT